MKTALACAALLAVATSGTEAAALHLPFVADPTRVGPLSPEGCYEEPGPARGSLHAPDGTLPYLHDGACRSGLLGASAVVFAGDVAQDAAVTAEFTSAAFTHGLVLAGDATLRVHYVDESGIVLAGDADEGDVLYELAELRADGSTQTFASGVAIERAHDDAEGGYGGQAGSFNVGGWRLSPGSRLRLRLYGSAPEMAGGRLLYGGIPAPHSVSGVPGLVLPGYEFGDAGLSLALAGDSPAPTTGGGGGGGGGGAGGGSGGGGSPAPALLLGLAVAALARRR